MQPVEFPKFGVVILAAGASTRMGSAKQLLDYQGKPLLRHTAEVALAANCERVIVVLGCRSSELKAALSDLPIDIVENSAWEGGMGTSIRAGVSAAVKADLDGVILGLSDQPLVTADILDTLFRTHLESGQPIVTSAYAGTVGVPVFFSREYFPHLLALEPSQGCKGVILKHTEHAIRLDCPEAEMDVDTPEDYVRVQTNAPAVS
jgi:molybdenum cofactor cytidylyltransferase